MSYALRTDTSIVSTDDVIGLVSGISSRYCYALEGGVSNPHLHFYLESNTKPATIRSQLRKLGLSGNGQYSLTVCKDVVRYIAYILKEGKFTNCGIDSDIIDRATQVLQDFKNEKKSKKVSIINVLEELLSKEDLSSMGSAFGNTTHKVFDSVIDYYLDKGLLVRRFVVQGIVDTLGCKHSKVYRHDFIEKFLK